MDLEQVGAREERVVVEGPEVGADAGAQLGAPVVLGGVHGLADALVENVDARAIGLQEAGLLAGEELVEGRARDAGGADDVRHRRGGVAPLGDHADHGVQQPRALAVGRRPQRRADVGMMGEQRAVHTR